MSRRPRRPTAAPAPTPPRPWHPPSLALPLDSSADAHEAAFADVSSLVCARFPALEGASLARLKLELTALPTEELTHLAASPPDLDAALLCSVSALSGLNACGVPPRALLYALHVFRRSDLYYNPILSARGKRGPPFHLHQTEPAPAPAPAPEPEPEPATALGLELASARGAGPLTTRQLLPNENSSLFFSYSSMLRCGVVPTHHLF